MSDAITFRASLPGRAPYVLTVRPYRIAGYWAWDSSWGPFVHRGTAADAAASFARSRNWPADAIAALAPVPESTP